MKKKFILIALQTLVWKVALWWCKSLTIRRTRSEKFDELRSSGKNYVVAFWHGSMLVGWFLHRPVGGGKISALVSQSSDGEYLSAVLERWGYSMIRGSSHIGGKEAMQLMKQMKIEPAALPPYQLYGYDAKTGGLVLLEDKAEKIRLYKLSNIPLDEADKPFDVP